MIRKLCCIMSPEAIIHNDVAAARKNKSHDHAGIANHVAAKDGIKHEKTYQLCR
jgi:hypothetical protein